MDKKIMKGMIEGGAEAAKTIMKDPEKTKSLIADVENIAASERSVLADYWQAITVLFSLMRDYFDKKYDKIPVTSVAFVLAAFLFIVSPFRVLPRWLPLSGFMERTFVLVLVLEYVKEDLQEYSNWKSLQDA